MASLHQRPFSAAEVGSVFCTEVGMSGRAAGVEVSRKLFSSNWIFAKIRIKDKKQYTESTVPSEITNLLIEKRVRQAAPAAQRRLAGWRVGQFAVFGPKAKPGASLPRSEISH